MSISPATPALMALTFATQKLLTQTNNVAYGTRGVCRVADTPDDRKGDYFFRDFFMVWVCGYMTEAAFRAMDRTFYSPLMTEQFKLHQFNQRYPGARNYSQLPEFFRNQAMGSLVKSDSKTLVPKVLKDLQRKEFEAKFPKDKALTQQLQALLNTPHESPAGTNFVADRLNEHFPGLPPEAHQQLEGHVTELAATENLARRDSKYKALFQNHPLLKDEKTQTALKKVVELEDARQRGFLLDHLHKTMNFDEYVKEVLVPRGKLDKAHASLVLDGVKQLHDLSDEKGSFETLWKKDFEKALLKFSKAPTNPRYAGAFNETKKELAKQKERLLDALFQTDILQNGQPEKAWKDGYMPALQKYREAVFKYHTADASVRDSARDALKVQEKALQEQLHQLGSASNPAYKAVKAQLESSKLADQVDKVIQQHEPKPGGLSRLFNLSLNDPLTQSRKELKDALDEARRKAHESAIELQIHKAVGGKTKLVEELIKHVREGVNAKTALAAFSRIQKNGSWPKILSVVVLNFIFYGWMASNFDNKILQPYQKKLVEQRGTSAEMATAGYMSFIPATGLFIWGMSDKAPAFIRKLGHFNRFAAVGGIALSAFAGGTAFFLNQLLKRPPAHKPDNAGKPVASQAAPTFATPSQSPASTPQLPLLDPLTLPLSFSAQGNAFSPQAPRQTAPSPFVSLTGATAPQSAFQPLSGFSSPALNAQPYFRARQQTPVS